MIGGINPWASMWTSPRSTIRTIVNVRPRYGVLFLASMYALQTYLFFACYWSLGLSFPFYSILITGIILSPLIGWIWLYFSAWILYFTGRWLGGTSTASHLRTAVAWSKIPSSISLLMWLILMISGADMVFVNGVSGPSSLFINFIAFILGVWAFILLVLSVREVQGFSLGRTLLNVVFSWLIYSVITFFVVFVLRYVYVTI